VTASSSVYLLASMFMPAVTGAIWTVQWATLSYSSEKIEGQKFATVTMNGGVAIAAQVLHGTIVALGLILSWTLYKRRTGLYHDPKGIGGLASLVSESDYSGSNTLFLFRQLPSFVHSKVLSGSLKGISFRLQHMPIRQGNGATRMVYQLTANTDPSFTMTVRNEDRGFYRQRGDAMGFWLSKRAVWGAEIFLWLGQAAIAGGIYQVAKVIGLDNFAERNKLNIAKNVYILCISLGGMMWQSIQRDVQLFEPWRRLTSVYSQPFYQALVRSDVVSLGLIGSLILGATRSLVALWASFAVIMVKVAIIFFPPLFELAYAAGFMNNSDFELRDFGVLHGTTGVALGASAVAVHVVIFCNLLFLLLSGRTRPFLPRGPTTIANQIEYLCRSEKLLADFAGTSTMSNRQLAQKLKNVDRTCRFGWFWWARGQAWCVGVEEHGSSDAWAPFDFNNGIYGFQPCT
jgi:hypothetical protein